MRAHRTFSFASAWLVAAVAFAADGSPTGVAVSSPDGRVRAEVAPDPSIAQSPLRLQVTFGGRPVTLPSPRSRRFPVMKSIA